MMAAPTGIHGNVAVLTDQLVSELGQFREQPWWGPAGSSSGDTGGWVMTHLRSQDPPAPVRNGMCRGARRPGSDTSNLVGNWPGDRFWVAWSLGLSPPCVKEEGE